MDGDERKQLVEQTLASMEAGTDDFWETNHKRTGRSEAFTAGVDTLFTLGTGFGPLLDLLQRGEGETLYRMHIPEGISKTAHLATAGGQNIGALVENGKGVVGQARFEAVAGNAAYIDPAMIAMAVALASINQKLNRIQKTGEEILDFLQNQQKAKVKGNLRVLQDVFDNYKFNWNNETYKKSKHIQVQEIKREAEKDILLYEEQLSKRISDEGGLLHSRRHSHEEAEGFVNELTDFQRALYVYSFASFLEVMLLGNFDQDYLTNVMEEIKQRSREYREFYKQSKKKLKEIVDTAIQDKALHVISKAGGFLGKAIEKTRLGDKTPIDEYLKANGAKIGKHLDAQHGKALESLERIHNDSVSPFLQNLSSVNKIYNSSYDVVIGKGEIRLLPLRAENPNPDNPTSIVASEASE